MSEDKKDSAPQQEEEIKEEAAPELKSEKGEENTEVKPAEKVSEEKKSEKKSEKADKKAVKKKESKKEDKKPSPEQEKIAELSDRYTRLYAEFDNFRRRSTKEKSELYTDIKSDTVKSFLPVYDNLERAINTETGDAAYAKGVELIMAQFMKTLESLGVSPIEDIGQKFDPNLHNAVMHVDDEEKGENEIVEVFQRGFMLGEKVIRFSMVKVAN